MFTHLALTLSALFIVGPAAMADESTDVAGTGRSDAAGDTRALLFAGITSAGLSDAELKTLRLRLFGDLKRLGSIPMQTSDGFDLSPAGLVDAGCLVEAALDHGTYRVVHVTLVRIDDSLEVTIEVVNASGEVQGKLTWRRGMQAVIEGAPLLGPRLGPLLGRASATAGPEAPGVPAQAQGAATELSLPLWMLVGSGVGGFGLLLVGAGGTAAIQQMSILESPQSPGSAKAVAYTAMPIAVIATALGSALAAMGGVFIGVDAVGMFAGEEPTGEASASDPAAEPEATSPENEAAASP